MNRKLAVLAVVAVLIVAVAAAVMFSRDSSDDGEGIEIIDALGRTVYVPDDVDEIVCLSAGSVRLACYLGAYDMIVGIDAQDAGTIGSPANYYKATYRAAYDLGDIANVGSEESFGEIIVTGADLVVTSLTDRAQVDSLQEKVGIPVIAIDAAGNIDVDDSAFDENLRTLGKAIGRTDRAEELIDAKDGILEDLASYKVTSDVSASCYIGGMFYMMQGGLVKTTGNYASFDYTDARNVMSDSNNGNPYDTTVRVIVEADPEYMFFDPMTYDSTEAAFDSSRQVLSATTAVEEGNLYSTVVFKYYGTNWEAELINAYYIGSVIDPETYSFDIEDKVNAVLDAFYPDSDITYDVLMDAQNPGLTKLDW